MEKPTLVYYEVQNFQKKTLAYMQQFFEVVSIHDPDHDKDDILKNAQVILAPMGFQFDRHKIDRCKALRVIGTPTTGTVHIDVRYAEEKEIAICSLKDQQHFLAAITSTAELAWGLLVAITRKLPWAHDAVCEGRWDGKQFGIKTPKMLSEMSIGIIGLGRLGAWVARYAQAFRMPVYYYDPFVTNSQYTECDTLHELAKVSDIVSLHVHLSQDTENLINSDFFAHMPHGSYLVNTARGGIVNETDLLKALESGRLAGAALDMLAGEHLPGFRDGLRDHPLIQYARAHDNLIITPKTGGCTRDAWELTEKHIIDQIMAELHLKAD